MKETKTLLNLSKTDVQLVKAVGILMIVLHNYMHWINPIGENEMDFKAERIYAFLESIVKYPQTIIEAGFTFFGHYGVLLFVFASAYGLTKRQLKTEGESYVKYLFHRLVKIYALLIAGLAFLYAYQSVLNRGLIPLGEFAQIVWHFLSMTGTFKFGTLFSYVGPWWFFGFIVQFYIVFPLLFYLIKTYGKGAAIILTLFSYITIYIFYFTSIRNHNSFPVFGNLIGHLPDFILSISLALFPSIKIDYKVALVALLVYVLSCFFEAFFPLSFVSMLLLLLFGMRFFWLRPVKSKLTQVLYFTGQISMFMFLVNGPLRSFTIKYSFLFMQGSKGVLLGAAIHLVLVYLIAYVMYLIYNQLAKPIKKYTGISIV